jgi:HlyD family secretion protein
VVTPTALTTTTGLTSTLTNSVSGIGEVMAAQDANLFFTANGTVAQVLVAEGDTVTQGQVLAILDTRTLDSNVEQAQAGLEQAQAQQAALTEEPRAADVRAAQAQVRSAQIALEQARNNQAQSVRGADSGVAAAQVGLETQRNQLSAVKTSAEQQLAQANQALVQAQASYSQAKWDYEHVKDDGTDPLQPERSGPDGQPVDNELSDSGEQRYYTQFVQAEAALRSAEQAVAQAQVAFDNARQAEETGIQNAEQQIVQAQSNADKLKLPAEVDQVAAAQAALDLANANRARLNPAPTNSQVAQAAAGVRQAEAQLKAAQVNRENAEIRAPFDGVIAQINIDPGDPSAMSGQNAEIPIVIIDTSNLYVEVEISDVDIGQVQVGQVAQLYAEAAPGDIRDGTVTYISPSAMEQGNIRSYLVRIALEDQEGLRAGMSVRVELLNNRGSQ